MFYKRLNIVYAEVSIETKQKARHLFTLLTVILLLLPVLIISDLFFVDDVVNGFIEAGLWLILAGIAGLLLAGKYKIACNATVIILNVILIVFCILNKVLNAQRLFQSAFYMIGPVLISLLVAYSLIHLFISAGSGLAVITGTYLYLLNKPGISDLTASFITALILYVMLTLIFLIIARSYQKNLFALEQQNSYALQQIAQLTNLISTSSQGMDISQQLEADFNRTARELENMLNQVQIIKTQTHHFYKNMEETRDVVNRITGAMQEFNIHMANRNKIIQDANAAVDGMVSSLISMDQITRQRIESIKNLLISVGQGMEETGETQQAIHKVIETMQSIREINVLINDVADKTHVLSINAAIEAARTGAAGKGFSIIAAEVRKLSESVARNSFLIAKNLEVFMKSVELTDKKIANSTASFRDVDQETRSVSLSLGEIVEITSELSSDGRQIRYGIQTIEESTALIQQEADKITGEQVTILKGVENVARLSSDIEKAVNNIILGVTGIQYSMQSIQGHIASSSSITKSLYDAVNAMQELK